MQHFPIRYPRFDRAFGLLATEVPTTGIIFVHGFKGNPTDTWVDFPGMIEIGRASEDWKLCDLFFYSYRSRDQIPVLVEPFLQFLTSIVAQKGNDIAEPSDYHLRSIAGFKLGTPIDLLRYRGNYPYRTLILVGHSTGGLIVREAIRRLVSNIVEENDNIRAWVKSDSEEDNHKRLMITARLRFFAPVHLGVLAAGKLGAAQEIPGIRMAIGCYLRSNPLYQNLRHDSPTILDLRKATERLYEEHRFEALKACSTFGEHEDTVYVGGYTHDYETQIQPNRDHQSICKPDADYSEPLKFVMTSEFAKNAR
jgi:hypothetical protein